MTCKHGGGFIHHLKNKSRILANRALDGEQEALALLQKYNTDIALSAPIKRTYAFKALARTLGFQSWAQLKTTFECTEGHIPDFNAFLYPNRCHVFWNIWSADYIEAKAIRQDHGGYLLPFKNQYMIVDDDYIGALTGDGMLSEWQNIGRDWLTEGKDPQARANLATVIADKSLSF